MENRTVGILGGGTCNPFKQDLISAYQVYLLGQLGRMLVESANNRNISVAILDKRDSPAKQVNATNSGVDGSFSDSQAIRALASRCDILTIEIEHVDIYVLEDLEREPRAGGKKLVIQPSWHAIRKIQDKYLQKMTLVEGRADVAESIPLSSTSEEELAKAAKKLGLPFMLKARTEAYDGRGNFPVFQTEDYKAALTALKGRPLYAERWVEFTKELAVMVVKVRDEPNPDAWLESTLSYITTETIQERGICKLVFAPAQVSAETNQAA